MDPIRAQQHSIYCLQIKDKNLIKYVTTYVRTYVFLLKQVLNVVTKL